VDAVYGLHFLMSWRSYRDYDIDIQVCIYNKNEDTYNEESKVHEEDHTQ